MGLLLIKVGVDVYILKTYNVSQFVNFLYLILIHPTLEHVKYRANAFLVQSQPGVILFTNPKAEGILRGKALVITFIFPISPVAGKLWLDIGKVTIQDCKIKCYCLNIFF